MKKVNKIAVVPDVHGKLFWKNAKDKIDSVDEVVFLGDYLDSYSFLGNFTREEEFQNLIEILDFKRAFPEKVILLLGNHDIAYLFDLGCSRQAMGEMRKAYKNCFEQNIDLFQMTEYVQLNNNKIIFSHAGILSKWIDQIKKELGMEDIVLKSAILDGLFNKLILKYKEPEYSNFLRRALWLCGLARGGFNGNNGSIVWADSTEWEGEENYFGKDVSQVIGHNRLYFAKPLTDGVNCVDTISPNVLFW